MRMRISTCLRALSTAYREMAASTFAWLSVVVKQAENVIKPREILKCSWTDTFGSNVVKSYFCGLFRTCVVVFISALELVLWFH